MGAALVGLVAYLSYAQEPALAVIVALGILVTMQVLSSKQMAKAIVTKVATVVPEEEKKVVVSEEEKKVVIPEEAVQEVKKVVENEAPKIIKETFAQVNMHKEEASKAITNGNIAEAEAHMVEASRKEEVVKAVIDAETHKAAAEEARANGNMVEAEAHKVAAEEASTRAAIMVVSEMARQIVPEMERHVVPEEAKVFTEIPEGNDSEVQLAPVETGMARQLGPVPGVQPLEQTTSEDDYDVTGFGGSELASL